MYHHYIDLIYGIYHDSFSNDKYANNLKSVVLFFKQSFLCFVFYGLNTTFSASKSITTLNCVFISYTPQKLSDWVANYNKNIVLLGKCIQ